MPSSSPYYRLDERFTDHPATESQVQRYREIRQLGKEFAQALIDRSYTCDELKFAVDAVDQAVMWANAGIARNE